MIKVIRINSLGWQKHTGPDNTEYFDSPVVNDFINRGYGIKDFKMCVDNGTREWTFIFVK